jgi:hypothetical protein
MSEWGSVQIERTRRDELSLTVALTLLVLALLVVGLVCAPAVIVAVYRWGMS